MGRFVLQRVVSVVAVLFAISVLTFLIFQAIPNGDPALRLAGRLATPQQVADVRAQWGFDKPLYVQYFTTMGKIFAPLERIFGVTLLGTNTVSRVVFFDQGNGFNNTGF